ncbi:hypothetical protein A2U01_0114059, partial [Trifolium medium]|nr:hypothetical protein [Trifolium medium]
MESLKENNPETDAAPDATAYAEQENLENTVISESQEIMNIPEKEKSPETTKADIIS